ncbi:MAG: TIGR02556 family CRISPR-associated protein [Clostridiaceae bacterium]|nr:TIGR02556 family CRISPR-associated protein [Clostridiaceae bacterium]
MVEDIYRIGIAIKDVKNDTDTDIEEDIMPDLISKKIDGVILINLSFTNHDCKYNGLTQADYGINNNIAILLKKKSPNGPNYGPSAQITDIGKTLSIKIIGWFKDMLNRTQELTLGKEDIVYLASILDTIQGNLQKIIDDYNTLKLRKGSYILSVLINGKHPVNNSVIFNCYAKSIRQQYKGSNVGVCSLCNRKNVEIISKSNVFKFYTHDKPGFISGGFMESMSWRNYPVCKECEIILSRGKKYIWSKLNFPYVDMRYYLIPSTTSSYAALSEIVFLLERLTHKAFSFKKAYIDGQKTVEMDIWDVLEDEQDINSFRLLFVQSEQAGSVERILLEIKDVYPSRIKRLHRAKEEVDNSLGEKISGFNFSYLRYFLSKSDKIMERKDLDKIFLDITRSIFLEEKVDLKILLPHFMRNIRQEFESDETTSRYMNTLLRAWACTMFLIKAGCIKTERGITLNTIFDPLFKKYGASLDSEIKCALFLTGALVRKVMAIQAYEISSTPFRNRLRGLKLRPEQVKGLITEAVQKMEEYEMYSKASNQIVETIVQLMLKTPNNWQLSVDEINFYIVAGMTLMKEIYALCGETQEELKSEDDLLVEKV